MYKFRKVYDENWKIKIEEHALERRGYKIKDIKMVDEGVEVTYIRKSNYIDEFESKIKDIKRDIIRIFKNSNFESIHKRCSGLMYNKYNMYRTLYNNRIWELDDSPIQCSLSHEINSIVEKGSNCIIYNQNSIVFEMYDYDISYEPIFTLVKEERLDNDIRLLLKENKVEIVRPKGEKYSKAISRTNVIKMESIS